MDSKTTQKIQHILNEMINILINQRSKVFNFDVILLKKLKENQISMISYDFIGR